MWGGCDFAFGAPIAWRNPPLPPTPPQRGGLPTIKQLTQKITGRAPFEVDESFVFDNIPSSALDDEDRELLALFTAQSREAQLEAEVGDEEGSVDGVEDGGVEVANAFYRICAVPPRELDDSSLEDIEHPERITSRRRTVFGNKGKFVVTDGTGRRTKLTKVYKRDDNRGALLNALKRMRLDR